MNKHINIKILSETELDPISAKEGKEIREELEKSNTENKTEVSKCCGAEIKSCDIEHEDKSKCEGDLCSKCGKPFTSSPSKDERWVEKCPRCGGQEFTIPEFICDKCHWQDPTVVGSKDERLREMSKNEIIEKALIAGFSLSTVYGQDTNKLIPISDTKTLQEFAKLVLHAREEEVYEEGARVAIAACQGANDQNLEFKENIIKRRDMEIVARIKERIDAYSGNANHPIREALDSIISFITKK